MSLGLFIGSGLITFSPLFALYIVFIIHKPYLLILSIGGAFFWLLGALLSSSIWYAFNMTDIWIFVLVESLLFQELLRFVLWKLYEQASNSSLMNTTLHSSKLAEEISIGAGISLAHSIIMFGSILWDAKGPGSFYIASCPHIPIFLISGIICLIISILDIIWTIIAYEGYRSRSIVKVFVVVLAHFSSSFLTVLNTYSVQGLCWVTIIGEIIILLFSSFVCYSCIKIQVQRNIEKGK